MISAWQTLALAAIACLFLGLQPALAQTSDADAQDDGAAVSESADGAADPALVEKLVSGETEFTEAEKAAIEEIIADYLMANPEAIISALRAYEMRQRQAELDRKQRALQENLARLEDDPTSPVVGNPDGAVTLVEFFDYRCPYCRRVAPALRTIMAQERDVRIVMKEFPVLGAESEFAAKAALAAQEQGMYEAFHFALMRDGVQITEAGVMAVAEGIGLDVERLKKDMESPEIRSAIEANKRLAADVGITGTPSFVVGGRLVPGAVPLSQLLGLIQDARDQQS